MSQTAQSKDQSALATEKNETLGRIDVRAARLLAERKIEEARQELAHCLDMWVSEGFFLNPICPIKTSDLRRFMVHVSALGVGDLDLGDFSRAISRFGVQDRVWLGDIGDERYSVMVFSPLSDWTIPREPAEDMVEYTARAIEISTKWVDAQMELAYPFPL